jgi:prophage regulatory protein
MDNSTAERRKYPRQFASRLVRIKEVEAICGLKRASIYNAVRLGTFPKPIKIGGRASAWIKQEVEAWVEQRIACSRRKVSDSSAIP